MWVAQGLLDVASVQEQGQTPASSSGHSTCWYEREQQREMHFPKNACGEAGLSCSRRLKGLLW